MTVSLMLSCAGDNLAEVEEFVRVARALGAEDNQIFAARLGNETPHSMRIKLRHDRLIEAIHAVPEEMLRNLRGHTVRQSQGADQCSDEKIHDGHWWGGQSGDLYWCGGVIPLERP